LLLHFEPSYALEILADKYGFKTQSHDAYQDSLMSMELFKIIIKKVTKILKKYPFLSDVLLKSDSVFGKILNIQKTNQQLFSIPKKPLNIQKAKKLKTT
jgi:DNA polymerase III epsilon subunit-like protein